jgi:hypothetical protein
VIALHDVEQVLRRRIFVRQDARLGPVLVCCLMIKAGGDVGAATLLPPLEDQRADLARSLLLALQLAVDVLLALVEDGRAALSLSRMVRQARA